MPFIPGEGYRSTSAWKCGMNLLRHACIITTKTTTNDDCVGIWGNKKKGRGETNICKLSQPVAGPRIRAT